MELFKNIWNKIKQPKTIWLVLFYIFFLLVTAGTLLLVIFVPKHTVFHYICYVVSAISLSYFVYTCVIYAPRVKAGITNYLRKHKFTSNLLDDYGYRTLIFSIVGFVLNILYVALIGVLAIITHSFWYISIAVYYLILILMKTTVFKSRRKNKNLTNQIKAYRACGIMFILLTIAFSGVIVLVYKSNNSFEYAGLMIYVVATFTFYKLSLAIYNIFKARKQDQIYVENIRNINLASALISIVALQVAMFQAFSPELNSGFANALTGAGVSLIIMTLGVLMIVKANKLLKSREVEVESLEEEQ